MSRILFITVILLVVMGATVYASDGEPSNWAQEDIQALESLEQLDMDVFNNYQQEITRGEFIYLAVRLYEMLNGDKIVPDKSVTFTDTQDIYAIKGASVGVTTGVGNGMFAPEQRLSREQLATFLVRILSSGELNILDINDEVFSDDASISDWAKESVYTAKANSIINGVGDNRFDPKGYATKEMTLVLMKRIMNNYDGAIWKPLTSNSHTIDINGLAPIPVNHNELTSYGINVSEYSLAPFSGANISAGVGKSENSVYFISSRGADHLYAYDLVKHKWLFLGDLPNYGMGNPAIGLSDDGALLLSQDGFITSDNELIAEIDFIDDTTSTIGASVLEEDARYLVSFRPGGHHEYAGTSNWGVYVLDKSTKIWRRFNEGLDDNTVVYKIKQSKDGMIWLATSSGVYTLKNSSWEKIPVTDYRENSDDYLMVPRDIEFKYDEQLAVSDIWLAVYSDVVTYNVGNKKTEFIDLGSDVNDGIFTLTYIEDENMLVVSAWWSGYLIYDINDFSKPYIKVKGSAVDAAYIDSRLFLLGTDGYMGVQEVDFNNRTVIPVNDGLEGFTGIYSAVVEDDVVKGVMSFTRVTLDYATGEKELYSGELMGEAFNLQKVGDLYYIQDYDRGLWEISNDFSEMRLLPNELQDTYGGSSFKVSEDGSEAWLFTNREDDPFMHYDLVHERVDYVSETNIDALYGSSYGFDVLERDGQRDIVIIHALKSWSSPWYMYISYNSGKTFEVLTTDGDGKDIFIDDGKVYYRSENGISWIDLITKVKGHVTMWNIDGELAGVDGGFAILAGNESLNIIRISDGKVLHKFDTKEYSSYIGKSFVDGAYNIVYSNTLYRVQLDGE